MLSHGYSSVALAVALNALFMHCSPHLRRQRGPSRAQSCYSWTSPMRSTAAAAQTSPPACTRTNLSHRYGVYSIGHTPPRHLFACTTTVACIQYCSLRTAPDKET